MGIEYNEYDEKIRQSQLWDVLSGKPSSTLPCCQKMNASDIMRGLKELADTLEGLPDAMRKCKAAESEIAERHGRYRTT